MSFASLDLLDSASDAAPVRGTLPLFSEQTLKSACEYCDSVGPLIKGETGRDRRRQPVFSRRQSRRCWNPLPDRSRIPKLPGRVKPSKFRALRGSALQAAAGALPALARAPSARCMMNARDFHHATKNLGKGRSSGGCGRHPKPNSINCSDSASRKTQHAHAHRRRLP